MPFCWFCHEAAHNIIIQSFPYMRKVKDFVGKRKTTHVSYIELAAILEIHCNTETLHGITLSSMLTSTTLLGKPEMMIILRRGRTM